MGLEKVLNKSRSESKYSLASFLLLLACIVIPVGGFALKNCHVSRNTALCHNEKLNAVPQDVPKTVTSLDLSGNKLSRIRRADFSHVPHLIQLDLNRNYILQVDSFSFSNLTSLQKLNLNHNKLDKLDSSVFHGLWSLTELRIAQNKIKVVSSTSFQSLSSLRFLDISYNNLNPFQDFRITADVFPNLLRFSIGLNKRKPLKWDVKKTFLRRVSSLDISQLDLTLSDMRSLFQAVNQTLTLLRMNAMKQNPNKLINLSCSVPSMSTLQFRRNKLRRIEARLLELCTNVTELDLADNDIQAISEDAFKCLPRLKTLTLSGNKLPFIPSATRNLPGLYKILYLQNNSISNLKDCVFEDLVRLEILKLQSNKIIKLNNAFKRHLPNLRFLYLSNNQLAMIEKVELKGLCSLQNLSLHQSNLGDLNEMSFSGLKNLIHMQLKSEHPCKAPFSHLSHLEDFIFSAQRFRPKSHLPVNFLQGLKNLLHFDTRSTQLVSLHKDTFNHTPKMENLLISSNDLKALSPELFTPIPNLKSLYISRTQLSSLDFFIDANLKKLEFLQARGNQYSDITKEVVLSLPALSYVDLQGNTFTCDCNNAQFLPWIKTSNQTQFYDAYNFLCRNPPSFKDKKLLNFDPSSCMVDTGFICFVSTTCSIVGLMLASLMFHFMRWQLVYSYYLFLAWLYDSRHQNKQSANQYDAFISYNNHDEESRDGGCACTIETLNQCISTLGTLVLAEPALLHLFSSFRLFDDQKDVLILIFREEIPLNQLSPYHRMRRLLKRQTYLSWARAQNPQVFWEKLRRALQSGDVLDEGRFCPGLLQTP
uniref:LRRCT domain-containing protein n=1 Tax=Oryzias latipes TaxID=8090 RepID=A0A3P9H1T5_ORYLA